MEITDIQIEGYKSISRPATIRLRSGQPTVLIGRNGSGKTNLLEALYLLFRSNGPRSLSYPEGSACRYRVRRRLSAEEFGALFPNGPADPDGCAFVVGNRADSPRIGWVESDRLVPLLKRRVGDIRTLAAGLREAVARYRLQLMDLCSGDPELPLRAYEIGFPNSSTNLLGLPIRIQRITEDIDRALQGVLDRLPPEGAARFSLPPQNLSFRPEDLSFRLTYQPPRLSPVEEPFIQIDGEGLKAAVEEAGARAQAACDAINRLAGELNERTRRLTEALDAAEIPRTDGEERFFRFLREARCLTAGTCLFLRSEDAGALFRKPPDSADPYLGRPSDALTVTYLRQVYQGDDREELLSRLPDLRNLRDLPLPPDAAAALEGYLNDHLPNFERGMYERVSVEAGRDGPFSVFLHERNGTRVPLASTSAGRRWYFTYWLMKDALREGDVLLIDEPAALLHPGAQRELREDLCDLAKRGIRVIYSTHSPSLIPNDHRCVEFVSMGDHGTETTECPDPEDLSRLQDLKERDIFGWANLADRYHQVTSRSHGVGKRCYKAVRDRYPSLSEGARDLILSEDTIRSWHWSPENAKFRSPQFQNVVLVAWKTGADIDDLIGYE